MYGHNKGDKKLSGTGEELIALLTSLMDGEMSQELRGKRSLGILQSEQEQVDKGQMVPMQSVLYALAMKVLTKDEIKKVKERLSYSMLRAMPSKRSAFGASDSTMSKARAPAGNGAK